MDLAKVDRTSAKRQLTIAINNLKLTITNEGDAKTVSDRYETVKSKWSNLTEKHATYLAYAYPDDTKEPDESEDQWLEACFNTYTDAENQYRKFLQLQMKQDVNESKNKTKKIRNAVKFEKVALQSTISSVHAVIQDPEASENTIADTNAQLKSQLDIYHAKQREYIDLLSDEEEIDNQAELMSKMQSLYIEVNLAAGKAIKARSSKQKDIHKEGTGIKCPRLKMPSFNGNIRDYPCFKGDFQKQVMPNIRGEGAAAYNLRSCLSDEPLEIVRNVDDDIEEMWRRLDERYGRLPKLTDAIMVDIKHSKLSRKETINASLSL